MLKSPNVHRHPLFWASLFASLTVIIFLLRLTAPNDLEGYAQNRNVGYVMDAVWEGNWLVQTDIRGRVMSKPPLHTWLAGLFALGGGVNRVTLTLSSFLAVVAISIIVFEVGRQRFGLAAGAFAGLAIVLAPMLSKHIALVRTDSLFALSITVGAFAAFRVWERGGSWIPFWIAAAAATLIKGPMGPLLSAAGLLAFLWERRTDATTPRLCGSHWAGVGIFLLLIFGWFVPAVCVRGYDLFDKMIVEELFGQATGLRKTTFPGENLPKPALYFLGRFFPFSLFAFYGLWRVWKSPSAPPAERRFERFLFCWIIAGLLMFSLAAHHRADLLLPLWPGGALLAGREMGRLAERIGQKRMAWGTAAISFLLLGSVYWTYHAMPERRRRIAQYSEAVQEASRNLTSAGLDVHRLYHLDTPVTLQLYLGTYRPWITEQQASQLAAGANPVLLAVESPENYPAIFGPNGHQIREVFRWPGENDPAPVLRVFSVGQIAAEQQPEIAVENE